MENIDFIPIFEWTILYDDKEKAEIKEAYNIPDTYKIIATDNNGNILVESKNKLFQIDHEDPSENPYLLTDDFSVLKKLFIELCNFQECTIETPLKEIREAKKKLNEIKKECPKELRDDFENEIENLTELISDYKFYKSEEGKRYLLTEEYKKSLYIQLGKPLKYKYIEAEREFETELIKINGICINTTETIDEVKLILTNIEPPFKVEIGTIISFEEYQRKLNDKTK